MEQTTNNKIIIIVGIGVVLAIGAFLGFKLLSKDNNTNESNKSNTNLIQETKTNNNDYSNYTSSIPKEERTIDYYYNIYTPAFDKSKYDKKISFFGNIIEGPLTIKNLTNNNYTFKNNSYSMTVKVDNGKSTETYKGIDVYINGTRYPQDSLSSVVLIETENNENDEIYFDQSSIFQDNKNIIVPNMKNVDLNNITIDDLIDSLGVPTYVDGRETKLENAKKSFGLIYFSYIYDYDDDIFKFDLTYSKNGGIDITDMIYMGKQYYNRKVSIFNIDSNDYTEYNNSKEYYEHQYKLYQEDLKK